MQLGKVKRQRPPPLAGQGIDNPLFSDPCQFPVIKTEINRFCGR